MTKKTKSKAPRPKAAVRNSRNGHPSKTTPAQQRTYTIPDSRLEKLSIKLRQVRDGDTVRYEVSGDLSAPAPPIRDSKYLSKQQCIEL